MLAIEARASEFWMRFSVRSLMPMTRDFEQQAVAGW